MLIRPATVNDAEHICAIYNREVLESTTTLDMVARTVPEQQDWIRSRSGGLAVVVAELHDEIVGFGGLSFYRDRPGYRTSVEDSIYVDRDCQGSGVGSAMLGEMIEIASVHGFHAIFARIVGPQPVSVALHERHGFELVGIEREVARKFNKWHDVALMQRLI